jgi:hypothetical protein
MIRLRISAGIIAVIYVAVTMFSAGLLMAGFTVDWIPSARRAPSVPAVIYASLPGFNRL